MNAGIRSLRADSRGHSLLAFDAFPGFILSCSRRGCYTSGQPRRLSMPCTGFMGRGPRCSWARLCRGLHPTNEVAVGPGVVFSGS